MNFRIMKEMEYREQLNSLGIPYASMGMEYMNKAILMYMPGMTLKDIEEDIAEEYKTTPCAVDRALYHALSHTKYYREKGVKEFIAMISAGKIV